VAKLKLVEMLPLIPKTQVRPGPKEAFSVVQVVLNVTLSRMHEGLMSLASDFGIDPVKIPRGNCVVFVNRKMDYIKLLVGTESKWPIVAAYRLPPRQKFSLQAVADIAAAFKKNTKVDASLLLRQAMAEHFKKGKVA